MHACRMSNDVSCRKLFFLTDFGVTPHEGSALSERSSTVFIFLSTLWRILVNILTSMQRETRFRTQFVKQMDGGLIHSHVPNHRHPSSVVNQDIVFSKLWSRHSLHSGTGAMPPKFATSSSFVEGETHCVKASGLVRRQTRLPHTAHIPRGSLTVCQCSSRHLLLVSLRRRSE